MTALIEPLATHIDLANLVEQHQAGIWRYLRWLGATAAEADDLTQETFLAVTRTSFDDRTVSQTAAYLRAAARNQLLMLRRKQKRQIRTVDLESAESVWAEWAGEDGSAGDLLDALGACLEKLAERAAQAIDLQYRHQASRNEIAKQLDMKPDGVKTLLRRTRDVLRECIKRRLNLNQRAGDV